LGREVMETNKFYKVTNWHTTQPKKAMRVFLTKWDGADMVEGQVKDYTGISFSKWSHRMASSWTWTEVEG